MKVDERRGRFSAWFEAFRNSCFHDCSTKAFDESWNNLEEIYGTTRVEKQDIEGKLTTGRYLSHHCLLTSASKHLRFFAKGLCRVLFFPLLLLVFSTSLFVSCRSCSTWINLQPYLFSLIGSSRFRQQVLRFVEIASSRTDIDTNWIVTTAVLRPTRELQNNENGIKLCSATDPLNNLPIIWDGDFSSWYRFYSNIEEQWTLYLVWLVT